MISVCIATYNGENYIEMQLKSIMNQISENDEIIVQDDCSKDGTLEIVENMNDPRIKIDKNATNAGVIKTFEAAIKRSTGDYIFLSDQDDVWLPWKVEECLAEFNKSPNIMVVVGDAVIIDDHENVVHGSYFDLLNSGPGTLKNLTKNTFVGCCMALRRQVVVQALPIPIRSRSHDAWLGIVGGLIGDVHFVSLPMIYYRRHSTNASQMEKSKYSDIIRRRLVLVQKLAVWYFRYKCLNQRKQEFYV